MDGEVTPSPRLSPVRRGSAVLALPLLLCLASLSADLRAIDHGIPPPSYALEQPHLDGGSRMLFVKPAVFDNLSGALGFPNTGGTMTLWGAGATLTPGKLRAQASGWTGAMVADTGSKHTRWGLDLASLSLEQRYPYGSILMTAGTSVDYGHLTGSLDDYASSSLNRVEADLWGSSISVGVRWPAQTKLGFFVRTAWMYMQGQGVWHGPLSGTLGTTNFDLGGPSVTAQLEMSL